ncbi:E3 ubiquitin-protein ligase RNF114 [Hondaea fermentalgiana]|uniref:E3 ubiquitin-protein ligase RNF114 n=1 Tax=Hondaea fermentalgiana TaxID=2315210 RepID=A0A2R5GC11_9STRA|nr:E3 ubiquitin-protein ligase RNF114 [Hondaea fermentalgiana]|eukprot:GBG27869.1 E3 ubiquitin-protein ligase RNF114 [Hondaea fermentalgiana]
MNANEIPHLDCAICLEVREDPMSTAVDADTETAQALVSRKLRCPSCNEEVQASALRKHKAGCAAEMKAAQDSVEQARARVKPDASRNPNRSTFKCPFPDCPADHMDGKDLCAHFDTVHPGASCAAICPVCVTMPWGDPNYISRDVVGHIRLRHKFTYDEYVDYQEAGDEDAILQAVLRQSLEQR